MGIDMTFIIDTATNSKHWSQVITSTSHTAMSFYCNGGLFSVTTGDVALENWKSPKKEKIFSARYPYFAKEIPELRKIEPLRRSQNG